VQALFAGVDCQDDRLEATVVGWSKGGSAYVLAHETLWGGPGDAEGWRALDDLLRSTWRHPLGGSLKLDAMTRHPLGSLKLDAMAIDGGDGGQMKDVQAFAGPRLSAPTQSGSTRLSREW
jgi:phage terminase large subunit GpA-like protein